ncbi:glycine zipper family protein [Pseudomonas frederiksbergensis]|nr:glycine zipper family protein [Pseudomonas frederiksbergensis]
MKSRIWRLAGVGLLCVSVTALTLADEPQYRGSDSGERGADHQGKGQGHDGNNQPRRQNNEIIRGDNSRQFELHDQNQGGERQNRPSHDPNTQGGQWQNRVQHDSNVQERAPQQPSNNLPIQGRPDTVRQTQDPRRGYYQDEPRRNNDNRNWQTGGQGSRHDDRRWPGRPDGHGNGWGPGPQYRPGYVIDRFPARNYRVPYRGQDYFYSGGYWYRPQGPRYVVVQPPRGIRVSYLPDYAREVWIGGALLFLAAGSYYAYQESTRDYVVVEPPVQPQPVSSGYDVVAYPANGQSPEEVSRDGYECYRWAVEQSGFDPRAVTYQPAPSVVQAYRQAQGNCLSSRGYQVSY